MKRLSVLCLLVAGIIYSTAAQARICFLGDLECQRGAFDRYDLEEDIPCRTQSSSWIHENNLCEGLVYGNPVCNDNTGNYYQPGSCPSGYTDIANLGDKYDCVSSLMCNQCCNNEDIRCKSRYQVCENNSEGVSDNFCTEVSGDEEGVKKYGRCECNETKYPFDCMGGGIEGNYADTCIDSDGNTWFASCQCSSGYSQTNFGNIKCSDECENNCRIGSYTALPGTDKYCWEGAECLDNTPLIEQCTEPQQSDFDNFWGGYDVAGECQNLSVDCTTLGYNSGDAGAGAKCVGGSEPYRCPFDHTKVYCAYGIAGACIFYTKADCELSYFGSVCTSDSSNCYNPGSCKSGYAQKVEECVSTEEGTYILGQKDEYGCGACICQNTCTDKATVPENATAVTEPCTSCGITQDIVVGYTCNDGYQKDENGLCVKLECSEGHYKDVKSCGQEGGWELGETPDAAGCYSCVQKSCPEGSSTDKEQNCVLGEHLVEVGYSGEDKCYQCLSCESGYATEAKYCAVSGEAGWTLEGEADIAGCRKCTPKQCPDNTSTSATCSGNALAVATTFYSGVSVCYECQSCSDGYFANEGLCPENSNGGWTIGGEKDTAGCGQCVPKQCPSGTSTATDSFSGSAVCKECQTCSKNYATDARYCSTSSPQGWTLSLTDKDSIGCYKCTAKACPERSSTSPICMPGQEIVEAGYTGDEICYKCEGDPSTPGVEPTDPVTDPCDCPDGKPYLCDGVCSATGDNTCQMCFSPGEQTPGSCSDCPNSHYWFCPSQLQCYPKSNDVKPYSDCVACDQAPSTEIGGGTEDGGSSSGGGGGGGDGEISRPSDCQPGYDYCNIDPLHKCCLKQEDDAASSVQ